METIAVKTDPYDPRPVIQYAADQAAKLGITTFVEVTPTAFRYTRRQPPADRSHWSVDPEGTLYANVPESGRAEHVYEVV